MCYFLNFSLSIFGSHSIHNNAFLTYSSYLAGGYYVIELQYLSYKVLGI